MTISHSLLIQAQFLDFIDQGFKTVEGRLGSDKYSLVKPGDIFEFVTVEDETRRLRCVVLQVFKYMSFQNMLESQGLKKCLPHIDSIDEGVKVYRSFPGYAEGEKTYGAFAFHIKKIS
jgi:ASC-1-like (ASCH) protein